MAEPNKTLICTVGLPRAGKSTWARAQGHPIVCPDAIRVALHGQRFYPPAEPMVWAIAHIMVRALFDTGHNFVVLDACNVSLKRRDEWRSSAWETKFKVIETQPATCIERAVAESDHQIIDSINRMADNYEPLEEDELLWEQEGI
jgi:predicted kinase